LSGEVTVDASAVRSTIETLRELPHVEGGEGFWSRFCLAFEQRFGAVD
jgi:hypothetical protein